MFVYISGKIHKIKSNQIRNIQFINLNKTSNYAYGKNSVKNIQLYGDLPNQTWKRTIHSLTKYTIK